MKSWNPFTCGAIMDSNTSNIYAVTNNLKLWLWSIDEGIEKAKKYTVSK